jgi:hypothetical protein
MNTLFWPTWRSPAIGIMSVVFSAALLCPIAALRADDMAPFVGVWLEHPLKCTDTNYAPELGVLIRIAPKTFWSNHVEDCEEIKMWVQEGKLKVSASCREEEGSVGFYALIKEYSLIDKSIGHLELSLI